jgi:hypothetical protein
LTIRDQDRNVRPHGGPLGARRPFRRGLSADVHNKFRNSTTGFAVLGPQFDVVGGNPRFRPWAPTSSQDDFVPLAPGASAPLRLTSSQSAKSDGTLGWMIVALDDANGAPQADLIALPKKP